MSLYLGDVRDGLRQFIAAGVRAQTCVTSPPYWGLRDYGTAQWAGGDEGCDHAFRGTDRGTREELPNPPAGWAQRAQGAAHRDCYCGATRIDRQLGLEPTIAEYVANMVAVFRLVRDVLADDGTLWLNLGDSYAGSWGAQSRGEDVAGISAGQIAAHPRGQQQTGTIRDAGLKPKDLCGIPWRVAFALQADGWYLRQDIIWAKPNPMPESVTDRCTKSHEYLFLLSKRERYFYDAAAIAEPATFNGPNSPESIASPYGQGFTRRASTSAPNGGWRPSKEGGADSDAALTRNRRSVWTVATQPYAEAHFATFPVALVEPCIMAGTSQRGHCPACGKGWERIIEATGGTLGKGWTDHKADLSAGMSQVGVSVGQARDAAGNSYRRTDRGWQPGCACGREPVPGVVLDPFMGSGTVAQVAQDLGRRWIGCELNPEYAKLIRRRTAQQALLLAAN